MDNGIEWLVKYSRFDDGETTNWPEWLPQDPDDFCWGKHTCFRGVIAHLQALTEIPIEKRSLQVKQILEEGVEYLLIHHVYKHSHNLSKPIAKYVPIGFPLFGENDMLRMLFFLTKLACIMIGCRMLSIASHASRTNEVNGNSSMYIRKPSLRVSCPSQLMIRDNPVSG
jgi:hypothetical protein